MPGSIFMEVIKTCLRDLVTVRLDGNSNSFRPCATGATSDIATLLTKVSMECREDDRSLSSAANYSKADAINGATIEAVERIASAAWWAYERPFLRIVNRRELNSALGCIAIDDLVNDANIKVGTIPSIDDNISVATTLICRNNYSPTAVAGFGAGADCNEAIKKSFCESIQSLAASDWAAETGRDCLGFDGVEIVRRIDWNYPVRPDFIANDRTVNARRLIGQLAMSVEAINCQPQVYVASINNKDTGCSHRTVDIAQYDQRVGENVKVWTQHNV